MQYEKPAGEQQYPLGSDNAQATYQPSDADWLGPAGEAIHESASAAEGQQPYKPKAMVASTPGTEYWLP
jgi:hypothetical protein